MQLKGMKNRYGYTLAATKLGGGGEGDVYDIIGNSGCVAKILNKQFRTSDRRQKMEAMANDANAGRFALVAWPIDVLYDADGFCGFVMKKFSNREDLGNLLDDENISWDKRIVIAYNLCDIVSEIHNSGQCIGDMNPQNFGIDISQTLSCCAFDADSFHYVDRGITGSNQVYKCSVGVGAYLAPEVHRQLTVNGQNLAALHPNNSFSQDTDLFALAVLIFQLLFYGYHPFQAMRLPSYGSSTVVSKREKNIYNKMSPYFNPSYGVTVPKYSPQLNIIPRSIQDLFRRAFIGENEKDRPKPDEWQRELRAVLDSRKQCSNDTRHVYWGGLSKCPWCKSTPITPPPPPPPPPPSPLWKKIVAYAAAAIAAGFILTWITAPNSGSNTAVSTPRPTQRPATYQTSTPKPTQRPATYPMATPRPTQSPAAKSNYVSKKYTDTGDLPILNSFTDSEIKLIVEDWLAYPLKNEAFYAQEPKTTIRVGAPTRVTLFHTANYEGGDIHYTWNGGGDVTMDWSDGGSGWVGHSWSAYFTATEPCTIFVSATNSNGITAHMVIYAK